MPRSRASRSCRSTCAEGRAHRRDPGVRHAGDADRAHHLRRRRDGHRLQLHDRHRRLVGRRAAARPSGAAADRPRRRLHRGDLEGAVLPHPRDRGRRDHEPRARRDRHGAVGPALPARRAAAVEGGRRRAAAGARLHDRGRLAAPAARRSWSSRRSRRRRRASAAPRSRSAGRTCREDVARLAAVREAVGDAFEIMVDANQGFTVVEAIRRARAFEPFGLAWFEEPLPAEDLGGHAELARAHVDADRGRRIALSPGAFPRIPGARRLLDRAGRRARGSAASRRGSRSRTSPRRSTSPVCPHFLMELHVSLTAAVPNGAWVEYIPQLDDITTSRLAIARRLRGGAAAPGLGIDWDFAAIERRAVARARRSPPDRQEITMLTRASLTIRLHPDDDVVIARTQLVGGTPLLDENVTVAGLVPPGHKVATRAIRAGEPGQALQPDHRLRVARHRARRARPPAQPRDGRVRPRLRVRRRREADAVRRPRRRRSRASSAPTAASRRATTSASCRRSTARRPSRAASPTSSRASALARYPNVDGVVALTHGSGCGMDTHGEGMKLLRRTLGGYARHANFAGVLIVGLGCEANQISSLLGAEQPRGGPAAAHVQHPGHRRHREDDRARRRA